MKEITAQELIDEVDISRRYSVLQRAEKRMIERIAWGRDIQLNK